MTTKVNVTCKPIPAPVTKRFDEFKVGDFVVLAEPGNHAVGIKVSATAVRFFVLANGSTGDSVTSDKIAPSYRYAVPTSVDIVVTR
jgi:hypothetical protein